MAIVINDSSSLLWAARRCSGLTLTHIVSGVSGRSRHIHLNSKTRVPLQMIATLSTETVNALSFSIKIKEIALSSSHQSIALHSFSRKIHRRLHVRFIDFRSVMKSTRSGKHPFGLKMKNWCRILGVAFASAGWLHLHIYSSNVNSYKGHVLQASIPRLFRQRCLCWCLM